ncbi:MAG: hypothetical protein U1D30_20835 [Planctomycetota bacterium]
MTREFEVPTGSHEDSAFEGDLARLMPLATGLDRDRLMYRLGQWSVRKNAATVPWIWPTVAAGLLLTTVSLAIAVVRQPERRVVEKFVQVEKVVTHPSDSILPKESESDPARNGFDGNGHRTRDPWSWTLASVKPLRADSHLERRSEAEILTSILAAYPNTEASTIEPNDESTPAKALRLGDRIAWQGLLFDRQSSHDLDEL